ncbi:MAG TPA: FxDxF family PEP-CTERM protein [Rubrivivax sp.]|nr:FxDxF family PEP-CTERM protein [Burkholderiales bacterium]HNT38854.1 FxDxF family PEP-CTERM protein [Rubrivivax sp.]
MNMKLNSILAAAALAFGAAGAHADTITWDTHGQVEFGVNVVFGSFTDYFTFEISPDSYWVSSTAVANNLGGGTVLNISGGQYSLWSMGADGGVGGGDDSQLGGNWSFDGSTGNATNTVLLAPGKYFYMVTGTGNGSFSNGGMYSLTSTIMPVPEAETWAMMLAGLGVLGFLGARRRRAD